MNSRMAPASLQKSISAIQALVPDCQSIRYNPQVWTARLGHSSELNSVIARFPGAVSRADLRHLAEEAISNDALLLDLFIATMLFGFGTVGYGAFRTGKMLEGLATQPDLLRSTVERLLAGKLAEAHVSFDLARCRQPFFTKFFYTVGIGARLQPLPLILDSRVFTALDVLHQRGEIDQWRYYTRRAWTADGYAAYVEDMNQWAADLGCAADQIEMYLFQCGASLS